jgi:predicted Zn-dependent peptidase
VESRLPYQRLVLPNGLVVFLVNSKTVKTFYSTLYIKVGAINENRKNSGISHFLEHLIHEGTQNHKSSRDFSEALEFEGMYQNAKTSKLDTYYWIDSPSDKSEKTLDFLYELVFRSTLPESRIENVRQVILNEYFDVWSEPLNQFSREMFLKRTKFKNIYQNEVLGRPDTIKSFTRDDLLNWKNRYYQPSNMVLTIAGNFDEVKILRKIKNTFGRLKNTEKIKPPKKPRISYSDFLVYHKKDERDQIRFLINFPAFGWKDGGVKKRVQIGLLRFIVSDSPSSRLFKLLREDGNLVYFISSNTPSLPFMGSFDIAGSTSKNNILLVIDLIKKELKKLKERGILKRELEKAKNIYRRNVVCFNFETPSQIANWVVDDELKFGKIRLPEDYMKMAQETSVDDINRLACDIFDFSKVNAGVMGNLSKEEIEKIKISLK